MNYLFNTKKVIMRIRGTKLVDINHTLLVTMLNLNIQIIRQRLAGWIF